MSANITDYFNKASNMNGSYPAVATVTSARSAGGATLACDDLSSWATDTPVHFSTFQTTADGSVDTTTQTDWKGIVVGNTITEMTRLAGAADSGNASGDRVELNPTIGWLDDLVTGLLVSHKQNGGLKDSSVTESSITTGAVTTSKIADSAVTNAKIADATIQAQKIDLTTFTTNLPTSTKTQALGYTSSGTLIRVANVVVLQYAGSFNASPASGWISLAETVPQGYRPNAKVYCWVQTQSSSTFGQYEFSADGSIRLYNSGIGTAWHAINGVWITEDAWPSS